MSIADVAVLESEIEADQGYVQNRHDGYGSFDGSQYSTIGHYLVRDTETVFVPKSNNNVDPPTDGKSPETDSR